MEEQLKKLYLEEKREAREIAKLLNKTESQILYLLRKYKLQGLKGKNKSNVDEAKLVDTNMVLWYYLGLIASDGYIKLHKSGHYSVRLTIKNEGSYKVLCKIAENLGYTNKVRQYANGFNELEIVNNRLLEIIKACNIPLVNKTFNIKFPNNLTEEQSRMFIRGCFDGDGSVSVKTNTNWGGNFKLISASKDFMDGLAKELNKWLNVNKTPVKSNNIYELVLPVKESMVVFDWMYKNYEDFKIDYKYKKYINCKTYKDSEDYYKRNHKVLNIDSSKFFKVDDIV